MFPEHQTLPVPNVMLNHDQQPGLSKISQDIHIFTGEKAMFVRLNFTFQHRIVKFLNEADQKPSLCEDRNPG